MFVLRWDGGAACTSATWRGAPGPPGSRRGTRAATAGWAARSPARSAPPPPRVCTPCGARRTPAGRCRTSPRPAAAGPRTCGSDLLLVMQALAHCCRSVQAWLGQLLTGYKADRGCSQSDLGWDDHPVLHSIEEMLGDTAQSDRMSEASPHATQVLLCCGRRATLEVRLSIYRQRAVDAILPQVYRHLQVVRYPTEPAYMIESCC